VSHLAHALLADPHIQLEDLSLSDIGMGNLGMAALAKLVRQDRLRFLKKLWLSDNRITDDGVCALAEAIGVGPWLKHLESLHLAPLCYITNVGMGCMLSALIDRCPLVKSLH